ncbi:hypothetical protein [Agreia sp. Leaf210]|uniref:hypothetical protein n=1 Tax=Agreia sp. Leaf210 TaxID=1735682 RepID=UPI000701FCD9|nr:hypothetical protein [Agreia sp. Leaf210]KQM59048.1 hypothetical protein ASE64_06405 [Agreia sp. Leaf210]
MSYAPRPQTSPPSQTLATRWLLALVTVSLGGYLVVQSLSGQFIQLFLNTRLDASVGALLVLQLLFAVAVTVLGFFFAPATVARRSIAAGIAVAAVLLVALFQAVRLTARLGRGGFLLSFTVADVFVMMTLGLGLAWLIVRSRPGLSLVSLALVVVLSLAHWGLLMGGIESATTQIMMLILSAVVVAAIGWGGVLASRMSGRGAAPSLYSAAAQPPHQQPPHTQQNDRPAERGPVI